MGKDVTFLKLKELVSSKYSELYPFSLTTNAALFPLSLIVNPSTFQEISFEMIVTLQSQDYGRQVD